MSTELNPLVSIIIPVYNGSNYLREAVDSALSQTYKNTEVLVINDGSNDGGKTEAVAASYGNKIRYFRKENGGVSSALNLGIKEMKGKYFSWLSHDDVYTPDKIRVQAECLELAGCDAALYGDYDYIDERSGYMFTEKVRHHEPGRLLFALLYYTPVNGCTVLIPKKILDNVGLFDESLRTTQDIDMWFRIAKSYDFIHLPGAYVKSRIHGEQGCWTIPGHDQEQQSVRRALLDKVTTEEVRASSGKPSVAAAYTELAVRLKMERDYVKASERALEIAGDHMYAVSPLQKLKYMVIAAYCRRFGRKSSPFYWSMIFRRMASIRFLKVYFGSLAGKRRGKPC